MDLINANVHTQKSPPKEQNTEIRTPSIIRHPHLSYIVEMGTCIGH